MAAKGLDMPLGQLDRPLVEVRSARLLDGTDDVGGGDGAEQLAGVGRGPGRQFHRAETLECGLQLVGMLDATDRLDLAGPANGVDVTLGSPAGNDRQSARQQVVTSVA